MIRDNIPVPTSGRFPGSQLIASAAFPVSQWHFWLQLPVYSDEIAQDFHLLLFYPFAERFLLQKRHLIFSYLVFSCSERQIIFLRSYAYHSTLFFKVQVFFARQQERYFLVFLPSPADVLLYQTDIPNPFRLASPPPLLIVFRNGRRGLT